MSPAGATVLRDVLVLVPGEIVGAILVSPVELLRDLLSAEKLPAVRGVLDLTVGEGGLADTAAFPPRQESLRNVDTCIGIELYLWHRVDSLVILRVVLLLLCRCMPFLISPGVLGSGPSTAGLNGDIVLALADAEEALLSPLCAPGVADIPELLAIVGNTPTND